MKFSELMLVMALVDFVVLRWIVDTMHCAPQFYDFVLIINVLFAM